MLLMDEVLIVTRDVNGKRNYHYLRWDNVCTYIESEDGLQDEEILMVTVNNVCIYSALSASFGIDWNEIVGFFG